MSIRSIPARPRRGACSTAAASTESAVAALRQMGAAHANVMRDGERQSVPAAELVRGDLILIEEGDIVPADIRLLDVSGLECDESVLTGESLPVDKHTDPTRPGTALADLTGCALMGTIVHAGSVRS